MALLGVRVVRDDGTAVSGRRAVVRTLAVPLSFLFLGLGFAGILLGDRRRALHEVIAGTAVISSWTRGRSGRGFCPGADHAAASCTCRILHPAWSGGCSGVASAFSMGIRVPSGVTSWTGTLTSRTPLRYRAVTSAASTLAGSLTARTSDP